MTVNCDYDSVVGVILPVANKILPIVHLTLKLTKTHPLFYTFRQEHSGCVFGSGKNGSNPSHFIYQGWNGPQGVEQGYDGACE